MSEEGKKINIDGLLICDINIQSDFDVMNDELINNNNQDMVKPLLNCARALIENRAELIKFLLPYYLCRKESKEQSKTNNTNDNYIKLKRIYELILHYENEYGRKIALETIEVSNKVREITTIEELLEDLENNK